MALAVAPFDSLVAGAMGARWAWVHGVTATLYFVFVIGAMVPGVLVSGEHVVVCFTLFLLLVGGGRAGC